MFLLLMTFKSPSLRNYRTDEYLVGRIVRAENDPTLNVMTLKSSSNLNIQRHSRVFVSTIDRVCSRHDGNTELFDSYHKILPQ